MDNEQFRAFSARYVAATPASTCNNFILSGNVGEITGRMYYRVTAPGTFPFSFLFQNRVDSTFNDGKESRADLPGGEWEVIRASAGDGGEEGKEDHSAPLIPITFGGNPGKRVYPGEIFASDECVLSIPEGHVLCFEWTVKGGDIPFTPDKSLLPCFVKTEGGFVPSCAFPQPVTVGCRRAVPEITFFGDSITQGLGTRPFRYDFAAARVAAAIGDRVAIRNLALGYGRGQDAAKDGVWLAKAKTARRILFCFGVNDILQRTVDAPETTVDGTVFRNLRRAVLLLRDAGCEVLLCSVPPFDWQGEQIAEWKNVNDRLQKELAPLVAGYLDTVPVWGCPAPDTHKAKYASPESGSHPSSDGGIAMGDVMLRKFRELGWC